MGANLSGHVSDDDDHEAHAASSLLLAPPVPGPVVSGAQSQEGPGAVGRRRQAGHRHSRASPGMTLSSRKTCAVARSSPGRGTAAMAEATTRGVASPFRVSSVGVADTRRVGSYRPSPANPGSLSRPGGQSVGANGGSATPGPLAARAERLADSRADHRRQARFSCKNACPILERRRARGPRPPPACLPRP